MDAGFEPAPAYAESILSRSPQTTRPIHPLPDSNIYLWIRSTATQRLHHTKNFFGVWCLNTYLPIILFLLPVTYRISAAFLFGDFFQQLSPRYKYSITVIIAILRKKSYQSLSFCHLDSYILSFRCCNSGSFLRIFFITSFA